MVEQVLELSFTVDKCMARNDHHLNDSSLFKRRALLFPPFDVN